MFSMLSRTRVQPLGNALAGLIGLETQLCFNKFNSELVDKKLNLPIDVFIIAEIYLTHGCSRRCSEACYCFQAYV